MFTPSILRRQILRATSSSTRKPLAPLQKRFVHEFPILGGHGQKQVDGIPGLFSQAAYNLAWTEYQKGLVVKLNHLTTDTAFSDKPVVEIAIITARQADLAATFNYASQAHNNHFFFEALSSYSDEVRMPDVLTAYIPDTFSSLEAMKTELLATAEAMFGCGWVWLVLDHNKRFRIMCTYNAGTPYGEAFRRQDTDMNTNETLGSAAGYTSAVREAARGPGLRYFLPLVNVNCWEHAWITDYGVLGKRKYLEAWWKKVDWEIVAGRLGTSAATPMRSLYQR